MINGSVPSKVDFALLTESKLMSIFLAEAGFYAVTNPGRELMLM